MRCACVQFDVPVRNVPSPPADLRGGVCAACGARRVVRGVCARRVRAACAPAARVRGVSRCGRLVIIAMMSLVSSLTICATNVAVLGATVLFGVFVRAYSVPTCFSAGPRRGGAARRGRGGVARRYAR